MEHWYQNPHRALRSKVNTLREFKDIHPKKNPKKGEKHSTII
jgi:hypothetical protein